MLLNDNWCSEWCCVLSGCVLRGDLSGVLRGDHNDEIENIIHVLIFGPLVTIDDSSDVKNVHSLRMVY